MEEQENCMEPTIGTQPMWTSQQTKDVVNDNLEDFVEFVTICLDNEDFVKRMKVLLPFDNVIQAWLKIYDTSPVQKLGVSIMRMDFLPSIFSLGVSIDMIANKINKAINSTIFITAGKTLEELREYAKSENFSVQIKEGFEKQINISFSDKDKL